MAGNGRNRHNLWPGRSCSCLSSDDLASNVDCSVVCMPMLSCFHKDLIIALRCALRSLRAERARSPRLSVALRCGVRFQPPFRCLSMPNTSGAALRRTGQLAIRRSSTPSRMSELNRSGTMRDSQSTYVPRLDST